MSFSLFSRGISACLGICVLLTMSGCRLARLHHRKCSCDAECREYMGVDDPLFHGYTGTHWRSWPQEYRWPVEYRSHLNSAGEPPPLVIPGNPDTENTTPVQPPPIPGDPEAMPRIDLDDVDDHLPDSEGTPDFPEDDPPNPDGKPPAPSNKPPVADIWNNLRVETDNGEASLIDFRQPDRNEPAQVQLSFEATPPDDGDQPAAEMNDQPWTDFSGEWQDTADAADLSLDDINAVASAPTHADDESEILGETHPDFDFGENPESDRVNHDGRPVAPADQPPVADIWNNLRVETDNGEASLIDFRQPDSDEPAQVQLSFEAASPDNDHEPAAEVNDRPLTDFSGEWQVSTDAAELSQANLGAAGNTPLHAGDDFEISVETRPDAGEDSEAVEKTVVRITPRPISRSSTGERTDLTTKPETVSKRKHEWTRRRTP